MISRLRWTEQGWSFPRKTRTPCFARFRRRERLESAATSKCSPISSTSGPGKDSRRLSACPALKVSAVVVGSERGGGVSAAVVDQSRASVVTAVGIYYSGRCCRCWFVLTKFRSSTDIRLLFIRIYSSISTALESLLSRCREQLVPCSSALISRDDTQFCFM